MTDDEKIAECARQAQRPETLNSDTKIIALGQQCRDPSALDPDEKIRLAAGRYAAPMTKALAPDPESAKLDALAAMLRRPARPAGRRKPAPAPLQAGQPPARRQAPPPPSQPPMRTPPRQPTPSRPPPPATRPTGPAIVPDRRRTVRVRRADVPFVYPLGGYKMDSYHSFRDHMAYDLRRGIVSSNPAKMVDHAADRAGLDRATAAEWVERFLSDVQRHRERRKTLKV